MNRRTSPGFLMMLLCLVMGVAARAHQESTTQETVFPQPQPTQSVVVPRLIKFSGTLLDAKEQPMAGPMGLTFALYRQQTGGAALWMETQNVQPDAHGGYTVLLGANSANGVPSELFASGEARWLGIQVEQQPERERILLVSVPYALKAGDAETLGGKPASAYVTADASANLVNSTSAGSPTSANVLPSLPITPM